MTLPSTQITADKAEELLREAHMVAELFREAYKQHDPWPDATACLRLAGFLGNVANDMKHAERSHNAVRKRRETISDFKRLIVKQRETLEALQRDWIQYCARNLLKGADPAEGMLARLAEIYAAVAKAEPALLWPVGHRPGAHRSAIWHTAVFGIATLAYDVLRALGRVDQGGGNRFFGVSLDRRGPFIKFVTNALNAATGCNYRPATVATALRTLPDIAGVQSQGDTRKVT